MRVIHKASLVILLKDIYSKMPVTSAVILCNGKQNPYTRKKDGHYVFSNLYPGEYEISVDCKGYNSLNFSITLEENKTKEIISDLSYQADNQNIMNVSRLEITCKRYKKNLENKQMILLLKNELSFLKLIENAESGSDELKLNTDMNFSLLGQKYIYEFKKEKTPLFFWSYNQEKEKYILKDNLENTLESGGKFYAVWDLKTDSSGRLVMPIMTSFMKDDILEFEIISDNTKSNIEVDVQGKHDTGEVFYIDAKFRKMREKTEI